MAAMIDSQIKCPSYNPTPHAGLSLAGQYPKCFAQIGPVIAPRFDIRKNLSAMSIEDGLCCQARKVWANLFPHGEKEV
jgi:hypothetical protein